MVMNNLALRQKISRSTVKTRRPKIRPKYGNSVHSKDGISKQWGKDIPLNKQY